MNNLLVSSFLGGLIVSCTLSYILIWRNLFYLRQKFVREVNEVEKEINEQIKIIGKNELAKTKAGRILWNSLQKRLSKSEAVWLDLQYAYPELIINSYRVDASVDAFLSHSQKSFHLLGNKNIIGRKREKSAIFPEIDLSSIDTRKITSAKHAVITLVEGNPAYYTIQDLRSVNGTYLNGNKLISGEQYRLKDGDILTFGRSGIEMIFTTRQSL